MDRAGKSRVWRKAADGHPGTPRRAGAVSGEHAGGLRGRRRIGCDGVRTGCGHDRRWRRRGASRPGAEPDLARDASGRWLDQPGPSIWTLAFADLRRYDVGRLRPGSPTALQFPDQRSHDGARVPTLAAVLAALPDARFTIEVKTDPARPTETAPPKVLADAVLCVIDAARAAPRVIIESFDWRVPRHVRCARPDIRLAWLTPPAPLSPAAWEEMTGASMAASVMAEGGPIWAPNYLTLTHAQVREAASLGLAVLPWTINQPEDMRRLIAWGVEGLISDRPDLALAVIASSTGEAG